jgi:pyridoxal phosphate enzyme (YggS family)
MTESYIQIKKVLDAHEVTLVAVSKTKSIEEIMQVYDAGQRIFGENKVQELIDKQKNLPADILWHLVGHLQTNKVKLVIPVAALIHSVDSWKLLQEIEEESAKANLITDVLIQVHIAEEETKFGLMVNDARKLLADDKLGQFQNIRIRGLMGMATLINDEVQIRKEFQSLKTFFDEVRLKLMNVSVISDITPSPVLNNNDFTILSMGMSGDYKIAMEAGSNMVRIGTAIFGVR